LRRCAAESRCEQQRQLDVAFRSQHRHQVVELEDESDVGGTPLREPPAESWSMRSAADMHLAGSRAIEPADQVEKVSCRSPTGPSARRNRPGDFEREAVQHLDLCLPRT
jgi:hypothetical protein